MLPLNGTVSFLRLSLVSNYQRQLFTPQLVNTLAGSCRKFKKLYESDWNFTRCFLFEWYCLFLQKSMSVAPSKTLKLCYNIFITKWFFIILTNLKELTSDVLLIVRIKNSFVGHCMQSSIIEKEKCLLKK